MAAQSTAWAVLILLLVIPAALGRHALGDVIDSFHWTPSYLLAELAPWALLLFGVMSLVPVAASSGLDPESRLYPRRRRVYFTWGVVLYLLGAVLTVELFGVWNYAH